MAESAGPPGGSQLFIEDAAPQTPPPDRMPAMSFLEHLEELRRRIIYSLMAIAGGFLVAFAYVDKIYAYMQRPIVEALVAHKLEPTLVYLNPTEPFNIYLKIAAIAGIFIACPVVLYQLWAFIAPGLYRNERRYVAPFMISTVGLFLAGGAFGYKIAYPAALDFLIGVGDQFKPMITIGEYTDLFLTVILGLGLVFELPIVIFFLALMGVVTPRFLWNNLRYAILVIFIIAAVLTPTTDIMNMVIFAAPMVALYVVGIGVAWLVAGRRKKKTA